MFQCGKHFYLYVFIFRGIPLPLGAFFLEMQWEAVMITTHEIPPFTHSVPIGVLVFLLN
jgi:hypothetical protein